MGGKTGENTLWRVEIVVKVGAALYDCDLLLTGNCEILLLESGHTQSLQYSAL